MNKPFLLSIAFCLPFAAACGGGGGGDGTTAPTPSAAQTVSASLVSGTMNRTYLAYVPAKADTSTALPLVIALHGGGGSGAGMRGLTGLDATADASGFVVAYPDGYETSWADGRGTTAAEVAGVDDVAFASALIDDIAARTPVDRSRVYVTGISNGGMMSLRLACQLSEKIAAAAPVAANMPVNLSTACAPSRPVSVMFIHGDLDPLMPRNGGVMPLGAGGSVLSTAGSVAFWNDRNSCPTAPTATSVIDPIADNTSITLARYAGCAAGGENRFYGVVGGGHTWPSGGQYQPVALIGRTSRDIDASQEIWQFFRNWVR
jgi:polyhydroxybutyrate depolymerase